MDGAHIARLRLYSQRVAASTWTTAEQAVYYLGAMQAQDYAGALWSVGSRVPGLTRRDVEQAIADRKIVRTWPMRGTLHFVSAKDIRWLLQLTAPRVTTTFATRRRQLEISDEELVRAQKIIEDNLSGGKSLSRPALFSLLDANGIASAGQRGIHIVAYFAHTGVLCFGLHEGKNPTFTLLEEWVPKAPQLTREEALAELTHRYFTSHGPATERDFAGWTKLNLADVRAGLAANAHKLSYTEVAGVRYWMAPNLPDVSEPPSPLTYLLPGFDEFMLGYKDRSAALAVEHSQKIVPGNNGMFLPTIIVDGQVVGTWKRTTKKAHVEVALQPFIKLAPKTMDAVVAAAQHYGSFLETPVKVVA